MLKHFFFFLFVAITSTAYSQKKVVYQYYGGHGCVDTNLKLYADSSFLWEESNGLFIPHTKKRKGGYLLYENEIHLYQHKRLHFLIPFLQHKYREYVFEKDATNIYLYDMEEIKTKSKEDQSFIKAYNTLRLAKS